MFIEETSFMKLSVLRMLGSFNQHLPKILSNNKWSQNKPMSLLDIGILEPHVRTVQVESGTFRDKI